MNEPYKNHDLSYQKTCSSPTLLGEDLINRTKNIPKHKRQETKILSNSVNKSLLENSMNSNNSNNSIRMVKFIYYLHNFRIKIILIFLSHKRN